MKKISFYALMLALSFMTFVSCEKDTPFPEPEIDPTEGTHFDIWSPLGKISGMGTSNQLVKSVKSLESGELDFTGSGVDLSEKLYPHFAVKGKYYYQVSKDGRFGKYQITNNNLVTVSEIPFTVLQQRKYTQAWIDDKTLLMIGASGESDKMLWVKVDVEAMKELGNGELALPAPPQGQVFNTSGMSAYRKSDNTVLYTFVYDKSKAAGTKPRDEFYMAFVNAADMSVKKIVTEDRAEMMASAAFGELRQDKSFFDENGDYYIACNSIMVPDEGGTTAQHGALLRVKKGAMDFDKTYNGYPHTRGKINTINYLNNGKALLYMQDPMYTTNTTDWNSSSNPFMFYYIVLDLKTSAVTDLKEIPFNNASFSQMVAVVGKKAYIGANPKEGKSSVYIYDIATGGLTKGLTLADGFLIDRIVWIED